MSPKKVITIVNFVRSADPREDPEKLLFTFEKQIEQCADTGLPHTFLLQYDALAKPRFVQALRSRPCEQRELGVWIEMAREQVERCGLVWNGRPGFDWDWHVNPGFLMAYTQPQRKLLIHITADGASLVIRCEEERLVLQLADTHIGLQMKWHSLFDTESLTVAKDAVTYVHGGMTYRMKAEGGVFSGEEGLTLTPTADTVTITFES